MPLAQLADFPACLAAQSCVGQVGFVCAHLGDLVDADLDLAGDFALWIRARGPVRAAEPNKCIPGGHHTRITFNQQQATFRSKIWQTIYYDLSDQTCYLSS